MQHWSLLRLFQNMHITNGIWILLHNAASTLTAWGVMRPSKINRFSKRRSSRYVLLCQHKVRIRTVNCPYSSGLICVRGATLTDVWWTYLFYPLSLFLRCEAQSLGFWGLFSSSQNPKLGRGRSLKVMLPPRARAIFWNMHIKIDVWIWGGFFIFRSFFVRGVVKNAMCENYGFWGTVALWNCALTGLKRGRQKVSIKPTKY